MSSSCLNSLISHTRLAERWGCQRAIGKKRVEGGRTVRAIVQFTSRRKRNQIQTIWMNAILLTAEMQSLNRGPSACQPFVWNEALHSNGLPLHPSISWMLIFLPLPCLRQHTEQPFSSSPSWLALFIFSLCQNILLPFLLADMCLVEVGMRQAPCVQKTWSNLKSILEGGTQM